MNASLYKLFFHSHAEEFPIEKEFIVIGTDEITKKREASRIFEWYKENLIKPFDKAEIRKPLKVENAIIVEDDKIPANWAALAKEVKEQREKRPRSIGCIFRGGTDENTRNSPSELDELRSFIADQKEEHRTEGETYFFIGSPYTLKNRMRHEPLYIFEANNIKIAADIVQLHFITECCEGTNTEWCCPIYFVEST